MRLFRTAAPVTPLITLAQVYDHLRLDPTFGSSPAARPDDALIEGYIAAAIDHLDGYTGVLGRALVTQTWRAEAAAPDAQGCFCIPMPVTSVASVEVLRDDAYETVSPSLYAFRDMRTYGIVRPRNGLSWPRYDRDESAFKITFTCGYGAADDVPGAIKSAALLIIGGLYENREAIVTGGMPHRLPGGVDTLIAPYRIRPNG